MLSTAGDSSSRTHLRQIPVHPSIDTEKLWLAGRFVSPGEDARPLELVRIMVSAQSSPVGVGDVRIRKVWKASCPGSVGIADDVDARCWQRTSGRRRAGAVMGVLFLSLSSRARTPLILAERNAGSRIGGSTSGTAT